MARNWNQKQTRAAAILKKLLAPRDCSECPCAWENMSYEGECYDCGCVATRHMTGRNLACRLPMRIKRLIRRRADAKRDRFLMAEGEDMMRWAVECERKDRAMAKALVRAFPKLDTAGDPCAVPELRALYEEYLKEEENAGKDQTG